MRNSNLFLITCSGTKQKNDSENSKYDSSHSITSRLTVTSTKLLEGRKNAYELLTKSNIRLDGILLQEHPDNIELKFGPDFGGKEEGQYLEAVQRYSGRFYGELGESGIKDLLNSEHQLLIISGLYGLLSPRENIQLYECNLEKLREFHNNWTQNDLLTDILLDYINANKISSIVDLTSQHEYRNLIYWKKLYENPNLNVLHAHNQSFPGPQALIKIATYLKTNLIHMKPNDFLVSKTKVKHNCCLTNSIVPPEGWILERSSWIEKVLQEGETNTQEFKASLTGGTKDRLPIVAPSHLKWRCMKSIAALMNTEGGDLFIGIDDETKKVHGIQSDLIPYNNSEDVYLQVLDRMLLFYIGKLFVQNVRSEIWSYENKSILQIRVLKGNQPAYLQINEKGLNEKTFWIRLNVSDTRLKGIELHRYLKTRFNINMVPPPKMKKSPQYTLKRKSSLRKLT